MRGNTENLVDHFDLPEGSIPNGIVAVCQYLTREGEMKFGYIYNTTDLPISSTLGLLELAKLHLHRICQEDIDDV